MMHVLRQFRTVSIVLIGLGLLRLVATSTQGMTVVPPSFSDLVNNSDYVVRASVKSMTSEWVGQADQRHIITKVQLDVLEIVTGSPPQPLVLEVLGGRVGDEEMVIQGIPAFKLGEEDILFVSGNGRQFFPLTAASHGRYHVMREKTARAYVTRSNHKPLRNTEEIASPLGEKDEKGADRAESSGGPALSVEEFIQKIRAVNATNHRSNNP